MTARRTRYITVRLTEKEAKALLTMAASGDYNSHEDECPEIRRPSNRAESKIRRALFEAQQRQRRLPDLGDNHG